jgi:hypothetical protein
MTEDEFKTALNEHAAKFGRVSVNRILHEIAGTRNWRKVAPDQYAAVIAALERSVLTAKAKTRNGDWDALAIRSFEKFNAPRR